MDYYSLLHDVEQRHFTVKYDDKFFSICNELRDSLPETGLDSLDEQTREKIKNLYLTFTEIMDNCSCTDNLEKYLSETNDKHYYYVGINKFVLDYYEKNPDSEWKIKSILQLGYPFEFTEQKEGTVGSLENLIIENYLKNKRWSLFVFTKESFSTIVLGFDDRHTLGNSQPKGLRNRWASPDLWEGEKSLVDEEGGKIVPACDYYNQDHMKIINDFLKSNKPKLFTNEEIQQIGYSFTEIPTEYFKIEYLDYLSRYKKSVTDVFGLPDKNEKIKPLKSIVKFINKPNEDYNRSYSENRDLVVLVEDFFFKENDIFKPLIRVGTGFYDFADFVSPYEIYAYDISPYYLYCLLSSELVKDYYSERYIVSQHYDYTTTIPLEKCIYIQMSPEQMNRQYYKEKYELDINPRLKLHNMLETKEFVNQNAKEAVNKFLVEINDAIKNGLYYSATIVIGSVLEAFLIDWLTEIDKKDYFKEPYLLPEKNNKRADLKDYIDIIQKKRPDWTDGAKKATFIRTKRNTVHAKLYIEEKEISEKTCIELLNDLIAIIHNRWKD